MVLAGLTGLVLLSIFAYLVLSSPSVDYIDPNLPLAIHQHVRLIVYIGEERVLVPAGIGIDPGGQRVIHTHDDSGVLHIEDNRIREYRLGDFFKLWGRELTSTCLIGYCSNETHRVRVFVNGVMWGGDPREVPLLDGSFVLIVYGTEEQTEKILYETIGPS